MRRRIPWIASIVVFLVAVLSGCGSKNADSVVEDLNKVAGKLESYEGSGTMKLFTGQQPLEYKVEVWYQKPNFYRIALTNEDRDITQIVLRNDNGVFVLTPQLNKSYRFKSNWPENQGQVYLYQTLLQSITVDNSRQFTTDKDSYVFNVMAGNYQNGSFARQKIWLSKSDYAPKQVQVTDTNENLMVQVNFTSFQFGKKFDKSAFDMQQNMSSSPGSGAAGGSAGSPSPSPSASPAPSASPSPSAGGKNGTASAEPGTTDPTSGTAEGASGQTPAVPAQGGDDSFPVIEPDPDALPVGVEQLDVQDDIDLQDSHGVMLRYGGTYDFTIVESKQKDVEEAFSEGIGLDLGFTLGLLSGDDVQTLTWTYDGVEYRLTTSDLPQEDMVKVAQSMVTSSGK
ncbi:outer membrane lipoprotein-sorting protein [Cohnella zeiphila]|uniref:Outer membrane lipoprotein carrier protein LolA n=1 Tax=Cohnella zeiphila TaxID=2761120 RepID=A0A7X0SL58_9BACL|nr:outer membrane lipoprotein-sorting protein [Cohnella zeiphila]MBB6730829.1 outer membrane lipoprotein carrier protein LolA [Cohnella zeiphila]